MASQGGAERFSITVSWWSAPLLARKNVLRDLSESREFYDAFRVTKSDALYQPDEDRVRIW